MADGQVALVTGATSVIGRAIAVELGKRGASLMLTGRREDVLAELAGELRERGVAVETAIGDVTDPEHVAAVVARTTEVFGPVTILVNNAGGRPGGRTTVAESDPQVWLDALLLNTYGPYLFARALLPSMLENKRGRIITVSSRAATLPVVQASDYVTAKTAVTRLTEVIAAETVGSGVAVFSVDPGGVLSESAKDKVDRGEAAREAFSDPPEAAARLIANLASGHYDVLSGSFLGIRDDLDVLVEQKDIRALRVVQVPADSLGAAQVGGPPSSAPDGQQDAPPNGYRVVETAMSGAGVSTISRDDVVPIITIPDGRGLGRLWEADGVLSNAGEVRSEESPLFPAPGGVRFWTVTIPPQDPDAPPVAEFHQTATLDAGIVLSGKVVLELEDGTSTELSAGQAFAQQGTPHRWRNPHTVDAVVAVVMMGWDR